MLQTLGPRCDGSGNCRSVSFQWAELFRCRPRSPVFSLREDVAVAKKKAAKKAAPKKAAKKAKKASKKAPATKKS